MGRGGCRALLAGRKPVEGVDVADQLLKGVVDTSTDGCSDKQAEQEDVDGKKGLPAIGTQGPAVPCKGMRLGLVG